MRRTLLLPLALLVGTFLSACGWDPGPFPEAPADDPFADAALAERVERLVPDVEAVLGRSLGPVEVVVADRDEWADRFADSVLRRLEPEPEAEIGAWNLARTQVRLSVALGIQASVFEDGEDRIWLVPEGLAATDDALRSEILDVLLAHEMAHVAQNRFLGMRHDLAEDLTNETALARRAVQEGHAQWVARRVAARRGTGLALDVWWTESFESEPPIHEPTLRRAYVVEQATTVFAYREGEAFVEAVIQALGYDEALRRLSETPPTTVREILQPARWLAGEPPANHGDVTNDVLAFLGATPDEETTLLTPLLALLLGGDDVTALLLGVEEATTAPVALAHGTLRGSSGIATLITCTDGEAARTVADALVRTLQQTTATAPVAEPAPEAQDVVATSTPWGHHVRLRTIHDDVRELAEAQVLVIRRGRHVVELGVRARHVETEGANRLALQVAALLDPDHPAAGLWADRHRAAKRPVTWWRTVGRAASDDAHTRAVGLRALLTTGWFRYASPEEHKALENDSDVEVRATLLALLAEEGADHEDAAVTLQRMLTTSDPAIASLAARLAAPFAEQNDEVAATLVALIGHPDGRVRKQALAALVAADREPLLPPDDLAILRTDPDADTRLIALHASVKRHRRIGHPSRELVLAATRDDSARVRTVAWQRLLSSPLDALPVPTIRRGLQDPSPTVRMAVAMTLRMQSLLGTLQLRGARTESAFEPFELAALVRAGLHDEHRGARGAALLSAGRLGNNARSLLPDVARQLHDPILRDLAAQAVGQLGDHAAKAVPALGSLLVERTGRRTAAAALEAIGAAAGPSVPALRSALDLPHARTRIAAARALHVLDGGTGDALETVIGVVREAPSAVALLEALEALDVMEQAPAAVLVALRPCLGDPRSAIRERALRVLVHADTLDAETHRAAAALFCDDDEMVRMAVEDVLDLSRGLPPKVTAVLRERLTDLDPDVRGRALCHLAEAGAFGTAPLAPLVLGLTSPLRWVRMTSAMALWYLDRHARPALPALLRALFDPYDEVVSYALETIGEFGTGLGEDSVLALARVAVSPRGSNAYDAQRLLGELGAEAEVALPLLLHALGEDQPYERRRRACLTLTDLGPHARDALPALRALAEGPAVDPYGRLRMRARQAIEAIESPAEK